MKIAHLIPSIDLNRGGPSRSVRSMVKAQVGRGANVRLVFGYSDLAERPDLGGLLVDSAPLLNTSFSIPSGSLIGLMQNAIEWADLVHLHSVWNGVISLGGLMCRRMKKCTVLSPRGMLDKQNFHQRMVIKTALLLLLESRNLNALRGLHFQDESERSGCSWLTNIHDKPFLVQPNGVDLLDSYDLNHSDCGLKNKSRFINGSECFNLVYLGRLNKIKGIDLQIQLIADLRHNGILSNLYLLGPDDGMEMYLRDYAARLGVADSVFFVGPIYGDDRFVWLRHADAVLLTSYYECNSNVAVETFAAGGVLIATDSCHIDRSASVGAALMVRRDRWALLHGVERILRSPDYATLIRQKAYSYAMQNLDWDRHADEMLEFYSEILKR